MRQGTLRARRGLARRGALDAQRVMDRVSAVGHGAAGRSLLRLGGWWMLGISLVLGAAACAPSERDGVLELRLRLPPAEPGTTVWMQIARGEDFAFGVPWVGVGDDRSVEGLELYPAANEGADLAVSIIGREGADLRVRLWLCPPERRRAAPCDDPEPGVFDHYWLRFERPFHAGRTSRWSAAFEGALPDVAGWTTSPFWRAEPALPWSTLPPLRAPCDPSARECEDATRVDACEVWVPACRAIEGDNMWPDDMRFCRDGTHDADEC